MKDRLVQLKRARRPVVALTAYDYPSARLLDEAGIDLILVGDSLGMVVLGFEDTTRVTLSDMARHGGAVVRAVKSAMVAIDLPAGTYSTPAEAVASARQLAECGDIAVKIEGGTEVADIVAAVVEAGIPVVGHIGMLPQHIHEEGGYKIKGRTPEQAAALLDDAAALEKAGACAIVLELVTPQLSSQISASVTIPTIGIGSGEGCDGQIRVLHDIIGLYPWFRPKFVTPKADVAAIIRDAARAFADETRTAADSIAASRQPQ